LTIVLRSYKPVLSPIDVVLDISLRKISSFSSAMTAEKSTGFEHTCLGRTCGSTQKTPVEMEEGVWKLT
jgi:hypothetical protein